MDHEGIKRSGFEGGTTTWTLSTLPPIVEECCNFLEQNGFDDEGIFRVTGSFRDINLLKAEYSNGNSGLDLTEVSPHSVAGVLTHFFNESEEPIFPYEMYDFCIECMELEPESVRLEGIKQMLYSIPTGNFLIIKRFIHVLYECAKLRDVNKMGYANLSIALSPTMLRPKEETIETLISHGDTLANLIAVIIEHYKLFFESGPPSGLPESAPDSFKEIQDKSIADMDARLPPNFMADHGPRTLAIVEPEIPDSERPIAKLQAIWRGRRLRRKLKGISFAYQTDYNRACWDYLRRENNFVHAMKRAIRDFETSLGDNKAGKRIRSLKALNSSSSSNWQLKNAEAEVKSIVSGFKAIIEIHQILYEELMKKWDNEWPVITNVGKVIISKLPMFIVYNMYISMYLRVDSLVQADDNPELVKWMKITAGSTLCKRTLDEVLGLPFQHILGCVGPIQQFVNCVLTHKHDVTDTNDIVKAYALISRLAVSIGGLDQRISVQRTKAFEKSLIGLPENLEFSSPDHKLVKHGPLSVNKQWVYVFLFDDICFICQHVKDTFVYEDSITMKQSTVEDTSRLGFILHAKFNNYTMLSKRAFEKVGFFVAFQQVGARWETDRFGVPLDDLLKREGHPGGIPDVVEKLSTHLRSVGEKHSNADFYCMGCDSYTAATLRNALNNAEDLDSVDLGKYSPPVVVETLKLFLLELPYPLIDRSKCTGVLSKDEKDLNLKKFYEFIQSLPKSYISLLNHIADLLADTMLHPSILAQTWGHTLYRSVNQPVSEALQITGVTTIIRDLLLHYTDLCSPETGAEYFDDNGEESEEEYTESEYEDGVGIETDDPLPSTVTFETGDSAISNDTITEEEKPNSMDNETAVEEESGPPLDIPPGPPSNPPTGPPSDLPPTPPSSSSGSKLPRPLKKKLSVKSILKSSKKEEQEEY